MKLLNYTKINNYFINLLNNKKIVYNIIFNLKLIKLKILNFYIKISLVGNFIKLFKFSTNILILFIRKK